ncbi:MAG: serine/threonine protein kinase [Sandaracinaceae bacterium]
MSGQDYLRVVGNGDEPSDPLIGTTVDGRYRIEGVLGQGGMGIVYRATHTALNKALAVKVLRPEVTRDPEILARFRQEAQSASAIGNHHIIDISDFGALPDRSTYFVMEYLDGRDLTSVIEEDMPIDPARVVRVGTQLCDALGAAHQVGIVHRDLKPDNVFLIHRGDNPDFVKVLDFGIAKVGGASSKLTKAGQVFGTPHYMSPEQCSGAAIDHRTDIYARGVILYEISVGRVPFAADNLMGILTKHLYEQPIPPHTLPPPVDVPAGLEAVILKCLMKHPDQRYQSMGEVRSDLELVGQGVTPAAVLEAMERGSSRSPGAPAGPATTGGLQVAVGGALPARRGRLPWILAGLAVLVLFAVGGVGGAYYAATVGTPATAPLAEPPAQEDVPPTSDDVGADGVAAAGATEDPAEGAVATPDGAEDAPAPARILITSDPEAVEVYRGNVFLGNTPLAVDRPEGDEQLEVTLRQPGYEDRAFRLTAVSQEEIRVSLRRAARDGRSRSGRRSRGGSGRTSAAQGAGEGAAQEAGGASGDAPSSGRAGQGGRRGSRSEVLDPWAPRN